MLRDCDGDVCPQRVGHRGCPSCSARFFEWGWVPPEVASRECQSDQVFYLEVCAVDIVCALHAKFLHVNDKSLRTRLATGKGGASAV